jgi:hypothetical protein
MSNPIPAIGLALGLAAPLAWSLNPGEISGEPGVEPITVSEETTPAPRSDEEFERQIAELERAIEKALEGKEKACERRCEAEEIAREAVRELPEEIECCEEIEEIDLAEILGELEGVIELEGLEGLIELGELADCGEWIEFEKLEGLEGLIELGELEGVIELEGLEGLIELGELEGLGEMLQFGEGCRGRALELGGGECTDLDLDIEKILAECGIALEGCGATGEGLELDRILEECRIAVGDCGKIGETIDLRSLTDGAHRILRTGNGIVHHGDGARTFRISGGQAHEEECGDGAAKTIRTHTWHDGGDAADCVIDGHGAEVHIYIGGGRASDGCEKGEDHHAQRFHVGGNETPHGFFFVGSDDDDCGDCNDCDDDCDDCDGDCDDCEDRCESEFSHDFDFDFDFDEFGPGELEIEMPHIFVMRGDHGEATRLHAATPALRCKPAAPCPPAAPCKPEARHMPAHPSGIGFVRPNLPERHRAMAPAIEEVEDLREMMQEMREEMSELRETLRDLRRQIRSHRSGDLR